MARHRPRHARRPLWAERLTGGAWLSLPVTGVVALGAGVALALHPAMPQPAVTEAAAPVSTATESTAIAVGQPSGRRTSAAVTRDIERTPLTTPLEKIDADPTPEKTSEAGPRWAEVTLNLRSAPKDKARTSTDLEADDKVTATGYTLGRWSQVRVDDRTRWVLSRYLTEDKPKTGTAAGVSGAACPSGSAVENGLTPDAIKVHRAICHAFPDITGYGGVRADALPEHPSGRALDAMVSGAEGWRVAEWVRAHAAELGVSEVIHAQKIWTVQRSSEGWRWMSDRGSSTANHYDHVHVTVYGSAAS